MLVLYMISFRSCSATYFVVARSITMVLKCCVPKCRGNYGGNGKKVHVFTFPADEDLREKWQKAINRKHFTPTKNSVVCALHFLPRDIRRNTIFHCENGQVIAVPLKFPRLKKGAVPSIFPNYPIYLSSCNRTTHRNSPQTKKRRRNEYPCSNDKYCSIKIMKEEIKRPSAVNLPVKEEQEEEKEEDLDEPVPLRCGEQEGNEEEDLTPVTMFLMCKEEPKEEVEDEVEDLDENSPPNCVVKQEDDKEEEITTSAMFLMCKEEPKEENEVDVEYPLHFSDECDI